MKKVDSARCTFCFLYLETIEHLFFECAHVKVLLNEFNVIIRRSFGKNINFDLDDIILGYKYENVNDKVVLEINNMIIKFKQFVLK